MALLSSVMMMSATVLAQDALEEAPGKTDLPDVADRYEGTGYHAGSFWLLPTLETGIFYDSNVRADEFERGRQPWRLRDPAARTQFGLGSARAELRGPGRAISLFRRVLPGSHQCLWRDGYRIDIQRDLVFAAGIKGGLFEEQVGDFNTAYYADEPTEYVDFNTWASLNKAFNRLQVSVGSPTIIRTMMMSSRSLAPTSIRTTATVT